MYEFLSQFVDGRYAPHGYCLLWQPELVWTHVVSDALIAAAYFSIPIALIRFIRARRDVEFGWMAWLFALFILACGSTHLMAIWNLWNGDYGIEAGVKAVTAIASVPTAVLLWTIIPRALAIPSPNQLKLANAQLAASVAERDATLEALRREIEQRERAEAALVQAQKIEAVGQLTGGIAHDFNNLLQAVSGNLELIHRFADAAPKVRRYAANAQQVVERGTRLTGQLLAFSRRQKLAAEWIDLAQLLEGMETLLRGSVGPTIAFRMEIDTRPCPTVADRTQVELAILNIAINGRDAMGTGGVLTITLGTQVDDDGRPMAAIAIADTGSGMTPEVAARAFEPFFTTKGPGQGTGLGLSMAYGVASQAGGTVTIDSAPGRGTCVTMLLPLAAARDAPPAEAGTAAAEPADGPARRLLLVDDDADVRASIAARLREAGHEVQEAGSGTEALALIEQVAPEVMIADFAMPEMNGAELAVHARALLPGLRVVFITGFADSAALEAATDDMTVVLRKPFAAQALLAAL